MSALIATQRATRSRALFIVFALAAACSSGDPSRPPPPSTAVTFVGAGDIADCPITGDEETARLLDGISGTVFTAGDHAYPAGAVADFTNCYQPTWGRHKARTRSVPGNRDYDTPNATGYFDYFGASAGEPGKGYYSFDLGRWHIIALNSNIELTAGSPQELWLRADLTANQRTCTLAYWHHPRFSSSSAIASRVEPFWQALHDAGADVVVSAHHHAYERFAPQTPAGAADAARGIREFVVGTGGAGLNSFSQVSPNSEVRYSGYGVLKLALDSTSFQWEFVPTSGSFRDTGTGQCH